MKKKPTILGFIPARGGSKGIKRKNLKPICEKPLVYWSIKAAQESKLLDRFFVSTEDAEIKKVAQSYGAPVEDRPKYLARDFATSLALLQHAVKRHKDVDAIVMLPPTSPVRDGALIDHCIKKFLETGVDTLATGFTSYEYEWGSTLNTPRQKLKGWFYDDGNVYIHKSSSLLAGHWVGEKKFPLIIERHFNYEIDDMTDFFIVESLLKEFLKKKKKK